MSADEILRILERPEVQTAILSGLPKLAGVVSGVSETDEALLRILSTRVRSGTPTSTLGDRLEVGEGDAAAGCLMTAPGEGGCDVMATHGVDCMLGFRGGQPVQMASGGGGGGGGGGAGGGAGGGGGGGDDGGAGAGAGCEDNLLTSNCNGAPTVFCNSKSTIALPCGNVYSIVTGCLCMFTGVMTNVWCGRCGPTSVTEPSPQPQPPPHCIHPRQGNPSVIVTQGPETSGKSTRRSSSPLEARVGVPEGARGDITEASAVVHQDTAQEAFSRGTFERPAHAGAESVSLLRQRTYLAPEWTTFKAMHQDSQTARGMARVASLDSMEVTPVRFRAGASASSRHRRDE